MEHVGEVEALWFIMGHEAVEHLGEVGALRVIMATRSSGKFSGS